MNDRTLFRLHDLLRGSLSAGDEMSLFILLLLVWAHRAPHGLDISPQQLDKELQELAAGHPALTRSFLDQYRSPLKRVSPGTLAMAIELAQAFNAEGAATPVALPHLLDSMYAVDPSLPTLLASLSSAKQEGLAYLPWDFTGQLGAAMASLGAKVVIEAPSAAVAVLISMLHRDPWQIELGDPIKEGGTKQMPHAPYEVAVAIPPLNMKIDPQWLDQAVPGRFPEKTSSATVLGLRQLLAVTRGRIVVAVPNSLLFSSGAENSLREDLLTCRQLRAVVALPGGLLGETNLALSALVLDPTGGNQRVRFVNADVPRMRASSSRSRTTLTDPEGLARLCLSDVDDPDAVSVDVSEVLRNGAQLQVNRYVVPEPIARARAILSAAKTVKLEDVVDFVRPPSIVREAEVADSEAVNTDASHWVREVGAADLPEFAYITTPGRCVVIEPKARSDDQTLRSHDIVLIVKGSVGKVGIVPDDDYRVEADASWITGQSALALRVRDASRIDPRALFMQLRSPLGQQLLKGIVSGATIPLIQLKELRKLPVIVSDKNTQELAINALEAEAALEREIARLRNEQAHQANNLWQLT